MPEPDELVAVAVHALAHDRPDGGVQPGAVAAACQHAETHAPTLAAAAPARLQSRALLRPLTAVLSLALLAGCGGDGSDERSEPRDADTLVVYSSLPHTGGVGRAEATRWRPGSGSPWPTPEAVSAGYRVKLVELDSAEPDERDWDPDRVAENAGRAADDPAAIAYLGELELGASAVSLPVTNEESILQVSPTDGLTSLTVPQIGPRRRAPSASTPRTRATSSGSCRRTRHRRGRSSPARAERGAARLALAHDGGIFGRQLAGAVEQAAVDQGLEVTTVERVQPDLDEAPALAQDLAEDDPQAVIYLGIGGDPAETVIAAMADPALAGRPLSAASSAGQPRRAGLRRAGAAG